MLASLAASAAAGARGQSAVIPVDEAGIGKVIAGAKGQVLLLNFWATWCVPCRKEMPLLVKLARKLSTRPFALVTVSCDEPDRKAAAAAFLKQSGVSGTAYFKQAKDDEKFYRAVDAKWDGELPALFLYDPAGRKARVFLGDTPASEVEAAVNKLL
ncbi:MAG: TlpA family protein disulfide reductase [Bryobacteraceae bacterium]|nr:TlpA family protein disulfide reductase [Bryobacteraceae bacterium]